MSDVFLGIKISKPFVFEKSKWLNRECKCMGHKTIGHNVVGGKNG
jgi:hypothetical protein